MSTPNILDTFGHGQNWAMWLNYLKNKKSIVGLELGTFRGASAEWALSNVFTDPTSSYFCVDTFEGSVEHRVNEIDCSENEAIARQRLGKFPNVHIIKNTSEQYLRSEFGRHQKYDFIYVDAAHDAMNVLRDAVLSFDALQIDGTMIFDDYGWTVMPRPLDCPRMGIDAFLSCYVDRYHLVFKGSQVAIQKKF
jgi:predicted O-methyltransferase YrrM